MAFTPFVQASSGIVPPAGDIGGTTASPTVVSTHLSAALPIAQGGTGAATAAAALTALGGLTLQATTGVAGYTLINGTGNVITWTAPNDGALHRVLFFALINVGTAQTGGAIQVTFTRPDAGASNFFVYNGGLGTGIHSPQAMYWGLFIEANTTFTVLQQSAQTAGAATLWTEIWGL